MGKPTSFDDVQAEANQLLLVWNENSDLALGDLTEAQFKTMVDDFSTKRARVNDLRNQLTALVNGVNELGSQLTAIAVRARSVARGQYGPNSTQYEQLGGKRASERKPPKRKTKP
jgi:hypothetical protein